jgi:hypothetical protein
MVDFSFVAVLIGPPADRLNDETVLSRFMGLKGAKIVCGGTTVMILERHLKKEAFVSLDSLTNSVPPYGEIDGVELLTEGYFTLSKVLELQKSKKETSLDKKQSAAVRLLSILERAEKLHFFLGKESELNEKANIELKRLAKSELIQAIIGNLERKGKIVQVDEI